MDNIIELKSIDKCYGEKIKTKVLFNIDLNIKRSSFNSIIGQSGSGKSTLLNIIGTLDKPTSGKIFIDGKDTNKMNKNQLANLRNQTLGFIFQFHHLIPEFTAFENILIPYMIKNKKISKSVKEKANEIINFVGLSDVKNNKANNMSGGQQQRTAIARALINNPKIILADEPTGNLDSDTTENVYNLLNQINKKYKTTFLIVTHNRKIAEKAQRIIEIKDGKINMDISNI